MMMKSRSKTILVVPRPDGLLVSIDGVSHYRDMDATQLLWMAERFLKAGLEASREEKAQQQVGAWHQEGHKEDNV
jgi:hypothetical protein